MGIRSWVIFSWTKLIKHIFYVKVLYSINSALCIACATWYKAVKLFVMQMKQKSSMKQIPFVFENKACFM